MGLQGPVIPGQRRHIWLLWAGPRLPSAGWINAPFLQLAWPLAHACSHPRPGWPEHYWLRQPNAFNEIVGKEYLGWVRQAKGKADPQPESPGQGRG